MALLKDYSIVILGVLAALFIVRGLFQPSSKDLQKFSLIIGAILMLLEFYFQAETGRGLSDRAACIVFRNGEHCKPYQKASPPLEKVSVQNDEKENKPFPVSTLPSKKIAESPKGSKSLDKQALQRQEEERKNPLSFFEDTESDIRDFAFSDKEEYLGAVLGRKGLKIWSLNNGFSSTVFSPPKSGHFSSLAFSPDKKLVVGAGTEVESFELSSGKRKNVYVGQRGNAEAVKFSPSGNLLATAGDDFHLRVWDLESTRLLKKIPTRINMKDLAFSPDGSLVACSGGDGWLAVYKVNTGQQVFKIKAHGGVARTVNFSSDNKLLATGGNDKKIKIWNTSNWQLIQTMNGHTNWVRSVQFIENDRVIVSASDDKSLRLWNVNTGSLLSIKKSNLSWGYIPTISPKGLRVVGTGWYDKDVKVWDLTEE